MHKVDIGGGHEVNYHITLDLTPAQISLIKHRAVDAGIPIKRLVKSILMMCLEQKLMITEEEPDGDMHLRP